MQCDCAVELFVTGASTVPTDRTSTVPVSKSTRFDVINYTIIRINTGIPM